MTDGTASHRSPVAALVLGWILPGAGHAYAGQRGKAVLFGVLITGLLVAGFAMGRGTNLLPNEWWFAPQLGAGGPAALLTPLSQYLAIRQPVDWASPVREIGTLYTAVAGLLNLLVMMDAYVLLAYPGEKREREQTRETGGKTGDA
ncbi:MAG TPA: DUF6677 family protein [Phycisphaerae bacterium]|nr:DUF6677 family protein [Phycisphaerae bacterium]